METGRRRVSLVIGRFQPFHNGHAALLAAAEAVGPVVAGIGSSQESRTSRNPFTFEERKQLLAAVSDVPVVAIPDINDPPNWVAHVQSIVDFDLVYANDEETISLFTAAGIEVVAPGLQNRSSWEGTSLRQWTNWHENVPEAAIPLLETFLARLEPQ
jgi:nicotinamide-nucleotide adenylyltransferase